MSVYRVLIAGSRIILQTKDGEEVCGFWRNEYVWANTEMEAIEKAKKNVFRRLAAKKGVSQLSDSPLRLTVDTVEDGYPIWTLMSAEGFMFFDPNVDTD